MTVMCVGCKYAGRVRECENDDYADAGDEECMVAVSAGHEYTGFSRDSGSVSSVYDVLEMSLVMGSEELVECVRCICGWLGGWWEVRGEWMRGLGLGFTNLVGTGGRVSVFGLQRCGWCQWVCVGAWTRVWEGGLVVMSVRDVSLDDLCFVNS